MASIISAKFMIIIIVPFENLMHKIMFLLQVYSVKLGAKL